MCYNPHDLHTTITRHAQPSMFSPVILQPQSSTRLAISCSTAGNGTFRLPGMWPDGKPGLGSGSVPWNLPELRASTTCFCRLRVLSHTC